MAADLAFPGERIAIFIDRRYWHGCPDHYGMPSVNRKYWDPKIERNCERGQLFDQALLAPSAGRMSPRVNRRTERGLRRCAALQ